MSKFQELKTLLENSQQDFEKFYDKGNAAAGTRVRKAMQEIKTKCQEIRNDVSEKKAAV